MAVLTASNVKYTYSTKYQKFEAIKGISCDFDEGELHLIVGPSGSGKTTLLSLLAGLDNVTEGEIRFCGESIQEIGGEKYRRECVSVVYQNYNLLPSLTAVENVMYPMELQGKKGKPVKDKAKELLLKLGLKEEHFARFPSMLSGGEQQRVAVARALAADTKVILADEPTGNLDSENGHLIVDIFKSLAHEMGKCVVVITHDDEIAKQGDKLYRIQDGQFFEA